MGKGHIGGIARGGEAASLEGSFNTVCKGPFHFGTIPGGGNKTEPCGSSSSSPPNEQDILVLFIGGCCFSGAICVQAAYTPSGKGFLSPRPTPGR